MHEKVINQGLFCLDWLMDHKVKDIGADASTVHRSGQRGKHH